MRKARLLPLYFIESNTREREEYRIQLEKMQETYRQEAEFLEPAALGGAGVGGSAAAGADAAVFLQMTGAVFGYGEQLSGIGIPVIIMTSEFGTVEMWDWEIAAYLRENLGMKNVFTPYSQDMAKVILRSVAARNSMREGGKFLIFQDSPGEGMQAYIFKRFYWWEEECIEQIKNSFGVEIIFRSWKEVNVRAGEITEEEARELWEKRKMPHSNLGEETILNAVKLYIAIKEEADQHKNVLGIGSNCLNESFSSNTTPCLAWEWLFEYDGILWACEGDLVTLLSEEILYTALKAPFMMTNIYPYLVGMAALKHEKIKEFPQLEDSDNYALGVHCGYFGFVPKSFCCEWMMRPKVLEIVNENAAVIDCRMECGPVVLAKVHADMKKITVIEADLEKYVGYPGSDCRNGALLHFKNRNGHRIMESLSSHHAILIQGNCGFLIQQAGRVYGMEVEVI